MRRRKPTIIVKGSILGCVHYEDIVSSIGTCRRCGQVRNYSSCNDDEPDSIFQEKGRRGNAAVQERRKAGVYG